jgi:hypothetical protein
MLATVLRRDDLRVDERAQLADDFRVALFAPFFFARTHCALLLDTLCALLLRFVPLVPVCAFAIATVRKPSVITVATWERVRAVLI